MEADRATPAGSVAPWQENGAEPAASTRYAELEETLRAIASGEVDALVIGEGENRRVYTLQSAETPYRILVESMAEGAATVGPDGTVLYCNAAFAVLVGLPAERVIGAPLGALCGPAFARELAEVFAGAIAAGGAGGVRRLEGELVRGDGQRVPVRATASALPAGVGCDDAVCLLAADLTQERRTRELLATREELRRMQSVLESAMSLGRACAFEWRARGDELVRSSGAAAVLGEAAHARTREEYLRCVHPDDARALGAALGALSPAEPTYRVVYRIVRPDGEIVAIEESAQGEFDGAGRLERVQGISADVTDRARAEGVLARHRELLQEALLRREHELRVSHESLRLAERMAALGTFAAGLGHDMANALFPLRAVAADLGERADLPGDVRADVEGLVKALDYLQALSRGLRLFARDPEAEDEPGVAEGTDIAELWADVAPFLRTSLPRRVRLEFRSEEGLPWIGVAGHRLTQVLLNLVHNARDAVVAARGGDPEGLIRVRAGAAAPAEPGMVRIDVEDDGAGMTDEVRRRCIEPFYTTKARQRGTGLGLAMVHGIVQKAGGRIEIRSEPGRGATISLLLPSARPGRRAAECAGEGRTAAVLLADPRAAAFVQVVLEGAGYAVAPGRSGGQGPWSGIGSGGAPDLLVTDATPEGLASARAVRAQGSGRVVVLTGSGRLDEAWRDLGADPVGELGELREVLSEVATSGQAAGEPG